MNRYLCIHGHFYQPPRENPWLEAIELQDSAYPFHDWNERITHECYGPNGRSRILDDDGRIERIVNNYARMSFNFGPTLLSWLERCAPDVYASILEADRLSIERFGGHGSAMAQAYNHMILPLANERDRRTQVIWGIRDFEHRFGRRPAGMWLAETACNTETLETLAEHDIRFTVLAPSQASRFRTQRGGRWRDARGSIDPTRAYEAQLSSGRSIGLFFYDGPISQAVAFEGLLNSGEAFTQRLLTGLSDGRNWPQLMHIATDGETYGHHHHHGDMALARALEMIEQMPDVTLTNYAEYLELHPPTHRVEIHENTAWSCVHGVGRWMDDCGCHTGGDSGWNQQWRAPLRAALDWLRDELAPRFEALGADVFTDPWAARDEYIDLVLDRSRDNVESWLGRQARRPLDPERRSVAMGLLELQRHAMLMYTSCGWFFDELSRIETVQVMRYADRAIQLAGKLFEEDLEPPFLDQLAKAQSNIPAQGNGRDIYLRSVKPTQVDLQGVAAHFAIASLFEEYADRTSVYCYEVEQHDVQKLRAGGASLHIGRAKVTSTITLNEDELTFAVLHLGQHVINGAVRRYAGAESYETIVRRGTEIFNRADFAELFRSLDSMLGAASYSLASLFRDEQRRVVSNVLASTLAHVEASYVHLYEQYAPMCRFLAGLGIPAPRMLRAPAEFVVNAGFRDGLAAEPPDVEKVREMMEEASVQSLQLDEVTLAFNAEQAVDHLARLLRETPQDAVLVERVWELVGLVVDLPFAVNLSDAQNVYFDLRHQVRPPSAAAAESGDEAAQHWVRIFDDLGRRLGMAV